MGETAETPLTVRTALQTLRDLEGLEPNLFRRTQGITWMVWGLVTAGIFFTFSTFAQGIDGEMPTLFPFLWVPWIAAGVLATTALWRTAHLNSPKDLVNARGRREFAFWGLTYTALFVVGFLVYQGLIEDRSDLREPGYVLALLGIGYLVCSLVRNVKSLPEVRAVVLGVGLLDILTALLLAFLVPYKSIDDAYMWQTIAGAVVGGGGSFLGGIYLTTKG